MSQSLPFPKLGVRLTVFKELISRIGRENLLGKTTTDVSIEHIKPLTSSLECSYCELLSAQRHPDCAIATVFISHAWKFVFLDVVEALEHHFRDAPDTVLWFDLFSNNQHAAPNLDFNWWSSTFKSAIAQFGHTVLILYPWEDPIPLTRAWCLWEIYCTMTTQSKFEIAMCAQERGHFIADIQINFCSLVAMIARINVENSESWNASDREQIFNVIRQQEGGFDTVNRVVFNALREWAIETLRYAIMNSVGLERLYLIGSLGIVYRRYAMYALAEPCTRYACDTARDLLGEFDQFTLKCKNELVLLFSKMGKLNEALELARLCLGQRKLYLGPLHPDTLSSMYVLASILSDRREYHEAEPLFADCYDKSVHILGENHAETLKCMFSLASLYFAQGKYHLAEPLYLKHPDSEHCKHFLMTIYVSRGQYDVTTEYYRNHFNFSSTKMGLKHPETLIYMNKLALLLGYQGRYDEAVPMLNECMTLRMEVLGPEHPDTLQTMFHLGKLLMESKIDTAGGTELLRKVHTLQVRVIGASHPDTLRTACEIDTVQELVPVLRTIIPHYVCPIYWVSSACRAGDRAVRMAMFHLEKMVIEDVSGMYDELDETSLDVYNARQLSISGAPLADECPIAAFISHLSAKKESINGSGTPRNAFAVGQYVNILDVTIPSISIDDDDNVKPRIVVNVDKALIGTPYQKLKSGGDRVDADNADLSNLPKHLSFLKSNQRSISCASKYSATNASDADEFDIPEVEEMPSVLKGMVSCSSSFYSSIIGLTNGHENE